MFCTSPIRLPLILEKAFRRFASFIFFCDHDPSDPLRAICKFMIVKIN
jgi:hypothetical protein